MVVLERPRIVIPHLEASALHLTPLNEAVFCGALRGYPPVFNRHLCLVLKTEPSRAERTHGGIVTKFLGILILSFAPAVFLRCTQKPNTKTVVNYGPEASQSEGGDTYVDSDAGGRIERDDVRAIFPMNYANADAHIVIGSLTASDVRKRVNLDPADNAVLLGSAFSSDQVGLAAISFCLKQEWDGSATGNLAVIVTRNAGEADEYSEIHLHPRQLVVSIVDEILSACIMLKITKEPTVIWRVNLASGFGDGVTSAPRVADPENVRMERIGT